MRVAKWCIVSIQEGKIYVPVIGQGIYLLIYFQIDCVCELGIPVTLGKWW